MLQLATAATGDMQAVKLGSGYMSFGSILFAPPNHQRRKLLWDGARYWRLAQIIW